MSDAKRTSPQEAAAYQSAVVPRWSALFSRMLLSSMPDVGRGTVLDVGCGTGHPSFELLRRLHPTTRVIGVDVDAARVELARRRATGDLARRAFFKVEAAEELSFGDQVFDLAVGNLVLRELRDWEAAFDRFRRVVSTGGWILLTTPLSGTFVEVLDMFRELAVRHDLEGLSARVEEAAASYPAPRHLERRLEKAGFDVADTHHEIERLPFRNAEEIFADRVIQHVALPEWRRLAGPGDEGQRLLRQVERSLDVYFGSGPLSLTVEAGLVRARVP